jgi:hypothetical protein
LSVDLPSKQQGNSQPQRKDVVGPSVRGVNLLMITLTIAIIIYLWLEEVLDLPHMIGFQKTPINWVESLMETVVIGIAAIAVIVWSNRLLARITYLEGFHAICANCKKIRTGKRWLTIEEYMQSNTSLRLSHTVCPSCAKQLYGYDCKDGEEGGQGEESPQGSAHE